MYGFPQVIIIKKKITDNRNEQRETPDERRRTTKTTRVAQKDLVASNLQTLLRKVCPHSHLPPTSFLTRVRCVHTPEPI
jgi:hypothetical protein